MRRAIDIEIGVSRQATATETPLSNVRVGDLVIVAACAAVSAYLLLAASWVPNAIPSALIFAFFAAGPLVFRALHQKYGLKLFDVIASFWLLPVAAFGHGAFEPVVDALNPRLLDAQLAAADLRLFGTYPAAHLSALVGPVLTEFFMVSYYSYFLWPFILGIVVYVKGERRAFDEILLGLSLFFVANFILYAAVPAIGPRYFLANEMEPIQGLVFTPFLESLMRLPVFARDCFPSGHTGITLTVLAFAWLYARRFFFVMLPFAIGLIAGTLAGRFHYGVDLLFAVPLSAVCLGLAAFLSRAKAPAGSPVTTPAPAKAPSGRPVPSLRQPAKA